MERLREYIELNKDEIKRQMDTLKNMNPLSNHTKESVQKEVIFAKAAIAEVKIQVVENNLPQNSERTEIIKKIEEIFTQMKPHPRPPTYWNRTKEEALSYHLLHSKSTAETLQNLVKQLWDTVKADKIEKDLKEYREKKLKYLSKKGEEKISEESNPDLRRRSEDEDISHKLRKRHDQIEFERKDRDQTKEKERFDRLREEGEGERFEEREGEKREEYLHDNTFDWRNEGEDYWKERDKKAEEYWKERDKEEERKLNERDKGIHYHYEEPLRNADFYHQREGEAPTRNFQDKDEERMKFENQKERNFPQDRDEERMKFENQNQKERNFNFERENAPNYQREGERRLLNQKDAINPIEERNYETPTTRNFQDKDEERMRFENQKERNFNFGKQMSCDEGGNKPDFEQRRVDDENFQFQKAQQNEGIRQNGYIHPLPITLPSSPNNENIYRNKFDQKPNNLNTGERNVNMGHGI